MFIVMHQHTKTNSLYLKTYLAINLILIPKQQIWKSRCTDFYLLIEGIDHFGVNIDDGWWWTESRFKTANWVQNLNPMIVNSGEAHGSSRHLL